MSIIGEKHQRIGVENEAPELFGEHAVEPMWCVSVQEARNYTSRRGPVWEAVALLSLNCKTREEAVREARGVLQRWLDALKDPTEFEWVTEGHPGHQYARGDGGALHLTVFPRVEGNWKWRGYFAGRRFAGGVAPTEAEAKAAAVTAARERT